MSCLYLQYGKAEALEGMVLFFQVPVERHGFAEVIPFILSRKDLPVWPMYLALAPHCLHSNR